MKKGNCHMTNVPGPGESRLDDFEPELEVVIEAPRATPEQVKAAEDAVNTAIANNQTLQNIIKALGNAVKIAVKVMAACLVFAVTVGCAPPPAVTSADDMRTAAIVHYVTNTDMETKALRDAWVKSEEKRLAENFADALTENTDKDGKILASKAVELFGKRDEKKALILAKALKAAGVHEQAKMEVADALRLGAAVRKWMETPAVTPADWDAIINSAGDLAIQIKTAKTSGN